MSNYEFIIKTNSYVGNFERELVGYVLGTADDISLENKDFHGEHEMRLFWKEEFNEGFHDNFELKNDFLDSTYQEVDDWYQDIFYHMCDNASSLAIQLIKPFNDYWKEIIVRRVKKFFDVHPCKYDWTLPKDAKLLDLYLTDSEGNIIERYV